METNNSEPLMRHRKDRGEVKTGLLYRVQDGVWGKPAYCPGGLRCRSGVTLIQAFARNLGTFASRGCKRDGESPSEIGMQVQISNHLKLLWSKATVVSIEEKAYEIRQV
jgi:hypothetical protein